MIPRPQKPHRLKRVFQTYDSPIYFVTFCSWQRQRVLTRECVHDGLTAYAKRNADRVAIGRYVIMPDHLHLFARLGIGSKLAETIRLLKRSLSACLLGEGIATPHWQPGFFDHLMRSSESYSQKWEYVLQNPVRAGLVAKAEDWPYQGEIVALDHRVTS